MDKKWANKVFDIKIVRQYVKNNEMEKLFDTVPVITAWKTAMNKAKEGDYTFRVPKFEPRNPSRITSYNVCYTKLLRPTKPHLLKRLN